LAGYSQGAHVIGEFLAGASSGSLNGIAFVGLFGDPKFHAASITARGDTTENGVLEARIPYVPTSIANRTLSFCEATGGGDAICSNDPAKLVSGRNGVHGEEYQRDRSTAIPEAVNAAIIRGLAPRLTVTLPIVPIDVTETRPPVDIVFVIDTTGSMGSTIASVRAEVSDVATALTTRFFDARVALTEFRDQGDSPERRIVLNLTSDLNAFSTSLDGMSVGGGGDSPEAALAGLQEAFKVSWRNGASKLALLITDNPFKNPDPITGATIATVAREALEIDPVNIYPLRGLGLPESQATALADATEGMVVNISDSVGNAVVDALEAASVAPIALIDAPAEAPIGSPVTFSGGRSFDPDSVISSYEWDFNDDGVIDTATAAPQVSHVYDAAYDGLVTLRVVSDDGGSGNAVATIVVATGAAPVTPPSRPTLTATARGNDVELSWSGGAGGATPTGWIVYGNGEPLFAAEASTTSGTILDAPVGEELTFAVAADSDYGLSERSNPVVISLDDLRPVPFTLAGRAGGSALYATGTPREGVTQGVVLGAVRGRALPATAITAAGLTTIGGLETLVVRFDREGEEWEIRFRSAFFGPIGTFEVCGPPGCESGLGVKFSTAGMPAASFGGFGIPTTTTTDPGGTTTTSLGGTTTTAPGTVTSTTAATTTTTAPPPVGTIVTTTTSLPGHCAEVERQLAALNDPSVRERLAALARRCTP